MQENEHIAAVQKRVRIGEAGEYFLAQAVLSNVAVVVGGEPKQRKARRVKIGKVCRCGLKPKIRLRGKTHVKQVHEHILGSLKRLVLAACFNKKLLCQHTLDCAPCFLRHLLQVPVSLNTYKIAEADTGAYERRKPPPERTAVKGKKACTPRRQRFTAAYHGTRLVAYLAVSYRRAEKGIGKAERAKVGRDMERIVHYHDGAAQKRSCVRSKALQVVKREKILQQRLRSF